ncbi:MAG: Gfo/Idh/MocA family oxidoreductase [Rhodospirillales bacterium]|nr:Gfo/Idh/MocA family oxidoreductase [Rhodospirillales bacterium]
MLRFSNGAFGQMLAATSMYPGSLRRLQIAGRDGTAETLEDELTTWAFREETEEDDAIRATFGSASKTTGGAADPMAIDYVNHTRNIQAFLDAVDGKGYLLITGREARKAVSIIEAIYKSAATGKPANPK